MKKLVALFFAIPTPACVGAVFLLTGAETALFVGFLIPGEVTAILGGIVASQGRVPLAAVMAAAVAGAWWGDSVGFFAGRKTRTAMFGKRRERRWKRARAFLEHGGVAIFLGRFTPFVRTVMPAAAGAAKLRYARFLPWDLAAGLLWGVLSTLVGYWGGRNADAIIHQAGYTGVALFIVTAAVLALLWKRFDGRRGSGGGPRPR